MARRFSVESHAHAAYHEAGHFVVGVEMRISLKSVKLSDGSDGTLGSVADSFTNSARYYKILESEELTDLPRQVGFIMYLLAGQVAEELFTGQANPSGAKRDDDEIRAFALGIGGGEEGRIALTTWLRHRVEQLLTKTLIWARVAAVSEVLLANGKLSGKDGRAVCKRWEPVSLPHADELIASIPPPWEEKRVEAERRLCSMRR